MNEPTTLYIVVPCYNEDLVLSETAKRLCAKLDALIALQKVSAKSRILFVNDGSTDSTWQLIEALHKESPLISGLNLSRNRGHQNALLAGLHHAESRCDAAISMDADLQDDIDAIDEMLRHFLDGCDIVYGVRAKRTRDSFFKRTTAEGFYRVMKFLGASIVFNHADYRLMSARALGALREYKEVNLFLRGIVPLLGYKTETVTYERAERYAGETKYPLRKMISFAAQGITSFSSKPLRMITSLGTLIFLASIVMILYSLVRHFMGQTSSGWTSLICSIWAIGGLILLSLGVVGEYIAKIYLEVKARPSYHIDEVLED